MSTLRIDIFADIACPWCYIGERRLHRAVEALREHHADLDVDMRWRPFQLQPNLPPTGLPWRAFAQRKFGSWDRAMRAFDHVATAAKPDGITYHFDKIKKANHTADAHRLILFARQHDREWQMVEALYVAYFNKGLDLNNASDLRTVLRGVGLDPAEAMGYLASEAGKKEVQESQHVAAQLGIRGVPYFIFNQRHALSGAQPAPVFTEVLNRAYQEVCETA